MYKGPCLRRFPTVVSVVVILGACVKSGALVMPSCGLSTPLHRGGKREMRQCDGKAPLVAFSLTHFLQGLFFTSPLRTQSSTPKCPGYALRLGSHPLLFFFFSFHAFLFSPSSFFLLCASVVLTSQQANRAPPQRVPTVLSDILYFLSGLTNHPVQHGRRSRMSRESLRDAF